ncbi:MAG: acetate--CoA ligase family protein [candidate division Zixibacteria bacterium]|nr:acetate--CoA ligase family protein [candidate division Zixibacteria bacterium]
MRLYEYEARELFGRFKIPIPEGQVVNSPEEAAKVARELGLPRVLKSQVLTGGRGKAGGIKIVETEPELAEVIPKLFDLEIKGFPVEKLLIDPKLDIAREFYLGVTIDRLNYKLVVIACAEGGVEIEETARTNPEKIMKVSLDVDEPLYSFDAIRIGKFLRLAGDQLKQFIPIATGLYNLFRKYDAKLVEINPLVLTADGKLIAADARMSVDDDAMFRHRDLTEMGIVQRHEEGEMTPRERQATEWGIPYLDLDGDIGMFPGGAGFGIMGNDFIHYYGGKPANFMDSGGGPSPERLAKMLVLLDENPNVKVIFGARFGGISRCDDFAKGVLIFLKEHGLSKPMVMRFTGNMWEEGLRIFKEAEQENPQLFARIEYHGIETPIEEISQRAVALAKKVK